MVHFPYLCILFVSVYLWHMQFLKDNALRKVSEMVSEVYGSQRATL